MKFLAFLIVIAFLALIKSSELKYEFTPVETKCPLLLSIENNSETILLDMDVHTHQDFKTCILQHSLLKPVLLLNPDVKIQANVTRELFKTSNQPNVIIVTKFLKTKIFDSTLWQLFMRSNWSLLYIVITDGNKFKCKNDKMNLTEFSQLENIMNKLWHRFQIMRVGVVFPLACKQKMVIYNGKRPSSTMLYNRSIKLINATKPKELLLAIKKSGEKLTSDYPIHGSIFYRYPTAIKDCENLHYYVKFNLNLTNGFCGLDGMVMHDILAHFKFNTSFTKNKECYDYGYGVPGNVSGTLGCVIRKELDVSFNSRFITLYSDEEIYYINYVKTDTLCAMVRKAAVRPVWHGVFDVFSPALWALIGAVLVAIGGIMWATAMVNKTISGTEMKTFWWYLHNSVITTMVGYSPMKTRTLLIIRSACLLGSILILGIYQGHINRVYTTVERFQKIKTLKDLYCSGATLYTSPSMLSILRQIQSPGDKLQDEFLNRTHLTPSEHDRLGIVLQRYSAATVDRKSDAVLEILEQYSDSAGTPLIDIVDECFDTYYLSFITRSGFPFFDELQVFTERLNEAGLPNIYYKWTRQMLEIRNSLTENKSEPRAFSKIRLKDQCVAFGVLFIGTIVSAIVFAAEIRMSRRKYCKQCKLFKHRPQSNPNRIY